MLHDNPTKQSDSELNVSVRTSGDSMKVESTQNSPDDIMAHINLVFSDDPGDLHNACLQDAGCPAHLAVTGASGAANQDHFFVTKMKRAVEGDRTLKGDMRARKDSGSVKTGESMPQTPPRAHPPKRLLLASANARLLASLTRRLSAKGHRVCAITAPEDGPHGWSPNLYDAVVFSVDDESAPLASVCEKAKRADPRLLLVVLSAGPFQMDGRAAPDVVIAGKNEEAIAKKLLAILNSSALDAA